MVHGRIAGEQAAALKPWDSAAAKAAAKKAAAKKAAAKKLAARKPPKPAAQK